MTPRRAGVLSVLLAFFLLFTVDARAQDPDPRDLFQKCAPAVVMVTATETVPQGFLNRTEDIFLPDSIIAIPFNVLGLVLYPVEILLVGGPLKYGGSGVIIDEKGLFLTNHHVISRCNVFWATLNDGRVVRARVIGSDQEEDYALLQLDLKKDEKVPAVKLGDSARLRPGDKVFAIGSPLRLRQTLTAGAVAGLDRRLGGDFQDFIQMDMTIGHGSSGGPLFNADGEVVGLTAAMLAGPADPSGSVTFSIPINDIREGLPRLQKDGWVERGFLGVHVDDVTPRRRAELDLDAASGACVLETEFHWHGLWPSSPAWSAGLERGDVIVKYGDLAIDRARTLARAVLNTKPGTDVVIEFYRGKNLLKRSARIAAR